MLDNRVEKLITAIDKLRDFSVTQEDLIGYPEFDLPS